jgi:hypothetical protein
MNHKRFGTIIGALALGSGVAMGVGDGCISQGAAAGMHTGTLTFAATRPERMVGTFTVTG